MTIHQFDASHPLVQSAIPGLPEQVRDRARRSAADWVLRHHGADHELLTDLLDKLGIA